MREVQSRNLKRWKWIRREWRERRKKERKKKAHSNEGEEEHHVPPVCLLEVFRRVRLARRVGIRRVRESRAVAVPVVDLRRESGLPSAGLELVGAARARTKPRVRRPEEARILVEADCIAAARQWNTSSRVATQINLLVSWLINQSMFLREWIAFLTMNSKF